MAQVSQNDKEVHSITETEKSDNSRKTNPRGRPRKKDQLGKGEAKYVKKLTDYYFTPNSAKASTAQASRKRVRSSDSSPTNLASRPQTPTKRRTYHSDVFINTQLDSFNLVSGKEENINKGISSSSSQTENYDSKNGKDTQYSLSHAVGKELHSPSHAVGKELQIVLEKNLRTQLSNMGDENNSPVNALPPELKNYLDAMSRNIISTISTQLKDFQSTIDDIRTEMEKTEERAQAFQRETKIFQDETRKRLEKLEKNIQEDLATADLEERIGNIETIVRKTPPAPALYSEICKKVQDVANWANVQERNRRKDNIVIKGLQLKTQSLIPEINTFLKNTFGVVDEILAAKMISKPGSRSAIIVQLESSEAKREILQQKKEKLHSSEVFIEPDRTPEDRKIFLSLRAKAKAAREDGRTVVFRGRSIEIDGQLFFWNLGNNDIEPATKPQPSRRGGKNDVGGQNPPQELRSSNRYSGTSMDLETSTQSTSQQGQTS